MRRLRRRQLWAACLGSVAAVACAPIAQGPSPTTSPTPMPMASATPVAVATTRPTTASGATGGELILAHDGNFFTFDVAARRELALTRFPSGALGASPAASPDRMRIAYTYFMTPKSASDPGTADLYVMDAHGSNPRQVRAAGTRLASYEDPSWTNDGRAVVATLRAPLLVNGQYKGQTTTIQRIDLAGGDPATLAMGYSPTAAPDGGHLAYLTMDAASVVHLWVAGIDGSGAREILGGGRFGYLGAPRFAPGGDWIAVAAAPAPGRTSADHPLASLIEPAEAAPARDGVPAEIWIVRPDGSDARQVTHAQEHSPRPAWSPDGSRLAVASESGLSVVDRDGQHAERLVSSPNISGLDWLT